MIFFARVADGAVIHWICFCVSLHFAFFIVGRIVYTITKDTQDTDRDCSTTDGMLGMECTSWITGLVLKGGSMELNDIKLNQFMANQCLKQDCPTVLSVSQTCKKTIDNDPIQSQSPNSLSPYLVSPAPFLRPSSRSRWPGLWVCISGPCRTRVSPCHGPLYSSLLHPSTALVFDLEGL